MKSTEQQKFYGLDHLRALAILLVFFFHYYIITAGKPEWLPDVAKFGWTGVDLFFVLSGFLISSQLFAQIKREQVISFKVFFLKRFFRIIPAFLVTLALYYLIPFFREKESLPPLWRFLTFTQNFGLNIKQTGTFSHAWSLCVEEHFYLLLPLILIFLQRVKLLGKAFWLIVLFFLLTIILRVYSFEQLYLPKAEEKGSWVYWYQYIYYPTFTRLDGLLIGVSIAGVFTFMPTFWSRITQNGNLNLLIGLLILTAAYFICDEQQSFPASSIGFSVVALGYGFLVIGALSPNSFLYKWKSKSTTLIATLSYSIYLTHKGIIHMTNVLLEGKSIDENVILILSLVASIFAGYLLNLVIEKPFMKLRTKLLEKY